MDSKTRTKKSTALLTKSIKSSKKRISWKETARNRSDCLFDGDDDVLYGAEDVDDDDDNDDDDDDVYD